VPAFFTAGQSPGTFRPAGAAGAAADRGVLVSRNIIARTGFNLSFIQDQPKALPTEAPTALPTEAPITPHPKSGGG